jgi:ribosomal protein S6E (S10)
LHENLLKFKKFGTCGLKTVKTGFVMAESPSIPTQRQSLADTRQGFVPRNDGKRA